VAPFGFAISAASADPLELDPLGRGVGHRRDLSRQASQNS
jgi:hypothetical protein